MNFFNTYHPCKELQDVVELYWRSKIDLEQSLVQDMYTPTLQALTFNLSGQHEDILFEADDTLRMDKHSYLIGQPLSKRISLSNPQGINILGVKFTPLGLYLLTGIDMRHISDKIIDASDIWNYEITLLYEELLSKKNTLEQIAAIEHFLKRKKQQRCNEKISLLRHTLHQMENRNIFSVSQLRENIFTTKKTFERYFLNYIGVTPKQYVNISRFNKVRAHLDTLSIEPDWHDIVVNFGYYDQSHLIRDFKRYAGKTPTEYFSPLSCLAAPEPEVGLQQIFS